MRLHRAPLKEMDVIRADDLSSIAADARNKARHQLDSMLKAIASRSLAELERKRCAGEAIERSDWNFPASPQEQARMRELWIEGQVYEEFLRSCNGALDEARRAHQLNASPLQLMVNKSRRGLVGLLTSEAVKIAFWVFMVAAAVKVLVS